MSEQFEFWGKIVLTLILMVGSYLLVKDLTDFATPLAILIIFIDEMILFTLGLFGWKIDKIIEIM